MLSQQMFTPFANWYDLHYRSIKDYKTETERIAYILEKLETQPRSILDVACGTGEHARILSETYGYQVDGIDLEPGLIEIAQKKNPQGEFTAADMRSFSLPKQYDALTCLFSSIGYAETADGLQASIDCMARHLKPGGWLILEPWVEPDEWKPELVDASESFDPESQTRILQARQASTEGTVSVITIDYHIEAPNRNLSFTETHRLGLFTRKEIEAALSNAHFETRFLPKGVLTNPVYIACYTP